MSLQLRWRNHLGSVTSSVLCLQLIIATGLLMFVASQPALVRQYELMRIDELRHGPDRSKAARDLCACLGWQLGLSVKPREFALFELVRQMLCPTTPADAQE